MDICTKMMMGSNAPPSRRSPPRPIVQTHTIKNLPPDSGLCVQIPTVIKSTAGFRHFSRSIQAQSEMEKLYFILAGKPLGSDNWWCGHVYLAEDHPPCPLFLLPPLADVETLISSQGESVWEPLEHKTRFYNLDCFESMLYLTMKDHGTGHVKVPCIQ